MRSILALVALTATLAGCSGSGSSPAAASAPPPATSTPPAQTISGRLTATTDGGALIGATVTAGAATTTTDATGAFTLAASAFPMTLTLQGTGLVTRGITLASRPAGTVAVDAFRLDGQFDLTFYRQFVRNSFDSAGLAFLRRRTAAPNIYLRTVDDAGAPMATAQLDSTEAAIRSVASTWAGGQFGIASVVRGSGAAPAGDWILVHWGATNNAQCGFTRSVGGNDVELDYKTPNCGCGGVGLGPRTAKHELGHAFGFEHTDSDRDVMFGIMATCDADPSARERYHAALAYRRPVGNRDPDIDP
jgi:hypothetical protein